MSGRDRRVVWRACSACGRGWPFPAGDERAVHREWLCQVCFYAEHARQLRELEAALWAAREGGAT